MRSDSRAPAFDSNHLLATPLAEGIGPDLAGQARQGPALCMLACAHSTLERNQISMVLAQRFTTPHARKLSLRFAVLGVTLSLPRRDAHGDLSITEYVTGEPRRQG